MTFLKFQPLGFAIDQCPCTPNTDNNPCVPMFPWGWWLQTQKVWKSESTLDGCMKTFPAVTVTLPLIWLGVLFSPVICRYQTRGREGLVYYFQLENKKFMPWLRRCLTSFFHLFVFRSLLSIYVKKKRIFRSFFVWFQLLFFLRYSLPLLLFIFLIFCTFANQLQSVSFSKLP